MNKDKINNKIEDLEAELQQLKKLANEPETRKPEAGDVWEGESGSPWLIGGSKTTILFDTETTHGAGYQTSHFNAEPATYLGKFDEVYVKISDVRDALSVGGAGASFLAGSGFAAYDESREALRKLNITTD